MAFSFTLGVFARNMLREHHRKQTERERERDKEKERKEITFHLKELINFKP